MNPKEKEKENINEEELNSKTTQEEVAENEENREEGNACEENEQEEALQTEEEKLARELEEANRTIEDQKEMEERGQLILNGGEKTIDSILPTVDDFERALKNMETATDVDAVREGVELIYNKFMSALAQNGVKVIETKGMALDTDYHEAIAVIPAPDPALKGKILDCVQTGYMLNDKVIRHAKVVVGE